MVDCSPVCCMCGDAGFPDKLFSCTKCHSRIQHSYCSSYNEECSDSSTCDWCHQGQERKMMRRGGGSESKKMSGAISRSLYSGGSKIKESEREESSERGKNVSSAPSPRPSVRRYKLLKDVLC